MSTGAVGVLSPEPVRFASRTTSPTLRLVGPDERAWAGTLVQELAIPATRFTRRGRLVITLLATVAVALLAVGLATTVDAAAPQIDHATVVSRGQTLSEVAATQLPSLPIQDAVARIQLANGLSSSQVHAGQSLLIPVVP
jgi:hypothetical protein